MRFSLVPVLLAFLALPRAGLAQADEPTASVNAATGALEVNLSVLVEDPALQSALHSGLPVRIEARVELWRDGFFDSQEDGATWRASVIHDPVAEEYRVTVGADAPEVVGDLNEAGRLLDALFQTTAIPRREGRYYYLAEVDVETLDISDLEELGRWLQGDLGAVVRGNRGPESAISRGLRRVVVRALGLPNRRERFRTSPFDWTPTPPTDQPSGS